MGTYDQLQRRYFLKLKPSYRKENGEPTTKDDRDRLMWYGVGKCSYWTDDWNKLRRVGPGIPCCPTCGAVGMQCTAGQWMDGAVEFERDNNPGYVSFLLGSKEQCAGPLMDRWKKKQQESA